MPVTHKNNVVAVINSNEDIVETIQLVLSDAGFVAVGSHLVDFKKGRKDFVAFLQEHNPKVIVLDIAPPYQENWAFFQLMRNAREVADRKFVLTTTNKKILEDLVGATEAIEIVGKPFDIEEILAAVQKAASW